MRGDPLFQIGRARWRLVTDGEGVAAAAEAYQSVLENNPGEAEQEPEGHGRPTASASAAAGALRFGILDVDDRPAAVQLWVRSGRRARCLRVWSDPAHASLPLDDMLIEKIAAHLIDVDGVREIDLGSVEPEFATNWAPRARERIGVIAFNPRTWRGLRSIARHMVLPKALHLPRRMRRALLGRRRGQ